MYVQRNNLGYQGSGIVDRVTPREEWQALFNKNMYASVLPRGLGDSTTTKTPAERIAALTDSYNRIRDLLGSTVIHLTDEAQEELKKVGVVVSRPIAGVPAWVWVLGVAGVGVGAYFIFNQKKPVAA